MSWISNDFRSTILHTLKVLLILFSKRVNRCQKDGFLSVGARTDTIKLTMADTQDWWHQFPPLSGY